MNKNINEIVSGDELQQLSNQIGNKAFLQQVESLSDDQLFDLCLKVNGHPIADVVQRMLRGRNERLWYKLVEAELCSTRNNVRRFSVMRSMLYHNVADLFKAINNKTIDLEENPNIFRYFLNLMFSGDEGELSAAMNYVARSPDKDRLVRKALMESGRGVNAYGFALFMKNLFRFGIYSENETSRWFPLITEWVSRLKDKVELLCLVDVFGPNDRVGRYAVGQMLKTKDPTVINMLIRKGYLESLPENIALKVIKLSLERQMDYSDVHSLEKFPTKYVPALLNAAANCKSDSNVEMLMVQFAKQKIDVSKLGDELTDAISNLCKRWFKGRGEEYTYDLLNDIDFAADFMRIGNKAEVFEKTILNDPRMCAVWCSRFGFMQSFDMMDQSKPYWQAKEGYDGKPKVNRGAVERLVNNALDYLEQILQSDDESNEKFEKHFGWYNMQALVSPATSFLFMDDEDYDISADEVGADFVCSESTQKRFLDVFKKYMKAHKIPAGRLLTCLIKSKEDRPCRKFFDLGQNLDLVDSAVPIILADDRYGSSAALLIERGFIDFDKAYGVPLETIYSCKKFDWIRNHGSNSWYSDIRGSISKESVVRNVGLYKLYIADMFHRR